MYNSYLVRRPVLLSPPSLSRIPRSISHLRIRPRERPMCICIDIYTCLWGLDTALSMRRAVHTVGARRGGQYSSSVVWFCWDANFAVAPCRGRIADCVFSLVISVLMIADATHPLQIPLSSSTGLCAASSLRSPVLTLEIGMSRGPACA